MQRSALEHIPADYLSTKTAEDDIAAILTFRTKQPDVFLFQLTEMARQNDSALLARIETLVTKEDRSYYLMLHALHGDREALQTEYDLIPINRQLSTKLIIIEASARGGQVEFAKQLINTFPGSMDFEDDDEEKIPDIMARIAFLRGIAQNTTLKQEVMLNLLNDELHQLMLDLDKRDFDRQDRNEIQLYTYEQIFRGFYLTGLLDDLDKLLTVMMGLRYISLRDLLAVEYDKYHKHTDESSTAKLAEQIKGIMLSNNCSLAAARNTQAADQSLTYAKAMHLFAYKHADKADPLRKGFNPKLLPEAPQCK